MKRLIAISALIVLSAGFSHADSYNQSSAKALAQQLEGKNAGTRVESSLPKMTAYRTPTGANVHAMNGDTLTSRQWTESSNSWESTTRFKKADRVANAEGVTWTFRTLTGDGNMVTMTYHQRRRGKGESKRQGTLEAMQLQAVTLSGKNGVSKLEVAGDHLTTAKGDREAVAQLANRLRAAKPEHQAAMAKQLAGNVTRMTSVSSRVGQLGRSTVVSPRKAISRLADGVARAMGRRGK